MKSDALIPFSHRPCSFYGSGKFQLGKFQLGRLQLDLCFQLDQFAVLQLDQFAVSGATGGELKTMMDEVLRRRVS